MSKEKVIEYVMNSPYNTNRAVLEGLLDDISGEEYTLLFEEDIDIVNVSSSLQYEEFIDADTLKITFDGIEYECDIYTNHYQNYYGATFDDTEEEESIDFSNYPFILISMPQRGNMIITSTSGTHTIKVETPKESGDSSSDWSVAEVTFYNNALSEAYAVECAQVKNDMVVIDKITIPVARQGELAGSIIPGSATAYIPIHGMGYFLDSEYIYGADYTSVKYSENIELSGSDFLIKGNGTITLTGTQSEPD